MTRFLEATIEANVRPTSTHNFVSLSEEFNESNRTDNKITIIHTCEMHFLLLGLCVHNSVVDEKVKKKGANAKAEITSIETIENGTCANNIRYVLRFVGFSLHFSCAFVVYFYFDAHVPQLSSTKNMLPRITHFVTHSINNIITLMELS